MNKETKSAFTICILLIVVLAVASAYGAVTAEQAHDRIAAMEANNIILQERIAKLAEKLDKLQAIQTKVNRGGERITKRTMEVTAYWEGSCGKGKDDALYGITASGERVRDGMCAAGKDLPMGAKLYIPALGKVYTVADRGGAITEGKLDLYMPTAEKCYEFGRQMLEVYILEVGK